MKKFVLTLLAILACTIYPVRAYEYFTIYFSDGTKSQAFYATDVDSICYSKLSLDSIAYDEWQVQEIYTCDSVYRYPLAQIDSLSFKDVDINKVAENIANASEVITPLFTKCKSPIEICNYISSIRDVDDIEDAYVEGQTLFVKIKDWGYISFYYPIDDLETYEGLELSPASSAPHKAMTLSRASDPNEHHHVEALKACVVNQQFHDEKRKSFKEIANQFCVSFASMGIDAITINMPPLDFFRNKMFDYDILFIKTHGDYDEKSDLHWLCTGEELWSYNPNEISVGDIGKLLNVKIPLWLKHGYSPRNVSFMCVKEKRGGEFYHIFYTTISDEFIRSAKKQFRNTGSTIVFNTACESMMNNNKMAKAFESKGAGCYFGYDDSNSIGGTAGKNLFAHLLVGKSTLSAYKAIPKWCKEQLIYEDEDGEVYDAPPSGKFNKYNPKLKSYPLTQSLCITHPETLSAEEERDVKKIKLRGCMKRANISGAFGNSNVGFQYSTNSSMSQAKDIEAKGNYDPTTLYMSWEKTLDESNLEPNTTYYYRAYMNDGYSNCYGEIKSFKTPDKSAEPYWCYKVYNEVYPYPYVTFYYDNKRSTRTEDTYDMSFWENDIEVDPWHYGCHIEIDSTFSNYYPKSLYFGNVHNTNIEGLNYLNTDSMVTMEKMFYYCNDSRLDVSNFNTENVRSMKRMFEECYNLKELNLSNFNTSKVCDMSRMFQNCTSLSNIDVSNFDTSNVVDMSQMFSRCSVQTIDFRNLIIGEETKTSFMFSDCCSLRSIDVRNLILAGNGGKELFRIVEYKTNLQSKLETINLSNANTTNATSMGRMFAYNKSIKSLDLSSFDTKNVKGFNGMFYDCVSLENLDIRNFTFKDCLDSNSSHMFGHCTALNYIDMRNVTIEGNVGEDFFYYHDDDLVSLKTINLSNANTTKATTFRSMFRGCKSLEILDLSGFNTANVTDMDYMFRGCSSLTSIDLSSFNTSNVTSMSDMFYECSSLKTIYAGNWNIKTYQFMFDGCNNLVGGKGTKIGRNLYGHDKKGNALYYYCTSDGLAAHIDGGKDLPGLFTAK